MTNSYNDNEENPVNSYMLTPEQLNEIHIKYGLPGELSPGLKASKKRNRFYSRNNWVDVLKKKPAAEDNKDNTTQ